MDKDDVRNTVCTEVIEAVEKAMRFGFIVTVATKPLQPLAMGNYELVVSVREKRS